MTNDCKNDKCKLILKEADRSYLLAFSHGHIKMATHEKTREQFFRALDEDNLELKIVPKLE